MRSGALRLGPCRSQSNALWAVLHGTLACPSICVPGISRATVTPWLSARLTALLVRRAALLAAGACRGRKMRASACLSNRIHVCAQGPLLRVSSGFVTLQQNQLPAVVQFESFNPFKHGHGLVVSPPLICRGLEGPHDAGHYNASAEETGFFCRYGSWNSEYGRFFLKWYSDQLLRHCDRIMGAAADVLHRRWPQQQVSCCTPHTYALSQPQVVQRPAAAPL